jgi:16S rRNA (cytosine967-C5)-methyltransferase
LQNNEDKHIKIIITLLKQFTEGKFVKLSAVYRENPKIFHYYQEIVRYWSKLNYIIRKTIRSLKQFEISDNYQEAEHLYFTYRIFFEKASSESIIKELRLLKNLSKKELMKSSFYLFLNKLRAFSWKRAMIDKTSVEKLSLEEAMPTFFIKKLLLYMPLRHIKENISFMNHFREQGKISVRINDLGSSKTNNELFEVIQSDLKKYKIKIHRDKDIPNLFYIPIRMKSLIIKTKWYKTGNLIFQDKASAAVIRVLGPQINEFICDMCAAPGIKASLIAQYAKNQVRLIAGEFLTERANQMKNLFKHLSILKAHIINSDSIKFPLRYESQFDRILLDAPCTGSGTFLTNPELKWRQNEKFLHQNLILQRKLIESALKLLKPHGIFVYSTCSLYPDEGELQILNFLKELEPLKLPEWFSNSYKVNDFIIPGTGRLFPSIHHTQGFFIGKFKKKEK